MIYEYRRLLSEAWYANQTFWTLNLVAEALTFYFLRDDVLASPFMITTVSINLGVNCALVVMMIFTTRRTETTPRLNIDDELLLANAIADVRSPLNINNNVELGFSLKFQEKALLEQGRNYF